MKNSDNTNAGDDAEKLDLFQTLLVEIQNGIAILEKCSAVSYKTKHTIWPSHHTPGIYPTDIKIYVHRKTGTGMFILALIVTISNSKQPKCPSVNAQLNKLEHPCFGIALNNKNALLICTTTGMDLKGTKLMKKRQS